MQTLKNIFLFLRWPRLWRLRRGLHDSRPVVIYLVESLEERVLALRALKLILRRRSRHVTHSEEEIGRFGSDAIFLYLGHGSRNGLFQAELFGEAVRKELCQGGAPTWECTPLVLWASFSALWIGQFRRRDWLGFRQFIGCDLRGGSQSRWWLCYFSCILGEILLGAAGKSSEQRLRALARERYDWLVRRYDRGKRYSFLSVLCARAHLEAVDWGEKFWLAPQAEVD